MSGELITTIVPGSVPDSVAALKRALETRGVELFAVIDHAEGARKVGLELDDEVVVIFGNPTVGTKLMQDARAVGLDLPLRILIWREGEETHAAYSDPHVLAERFGLARSGPVLDGMTTLLAALVGELAANA
jgi:uncharacterized protein (DUF302 family)